MGAFASVKTISTARRRHAALRSIALVAALATLCSTSAIAQKPVPKPAQPAGAARAGQPKVEPDILSLKPSTVEFHEDGIFTSKICLKSPKARVLLSTPGGFQLDESAPTLTLISKQERAATVQAVTSRIPILPLDTGERRKQVRDTILATAPAKADRVQIVSESENPFPINGWMTFQYTMSYGLYGQTYRKQVVFVRLHPYQELQFTVHAPDRNFAATAAALGSILNSWYREPLNAAAASAATVTD